VLYATPICKAVRGPSHMTTQSLRIVTRWMSPHRKQNVKSHVSLGRSSRSPAGSASMPRSRSAARQGASDTSAATRPRLTTCKRTGGAHSFRQAAATLQTVRVSR
jgi:hypothetical protein